MPEQDFIGEIMGFDPNNLDVFQESEKKNFNENVYKTNPVSTKVVSEDGHYRSVVKILYNPLNIKRSIVNQCQYVLEDENGMFFVKSSLSEGNKDCPIFKTWKKLWFTKGNDKDKNGRDCDLSIRKFCQDVFQKNESQWVIVQVIEDDNQPDLVGKIMVMKLPKPVYAKLQAKMNPSTDSKKAPIALMDYLIGPTLEMDVTPGPNDPTNPNRRQREISYDLCEFSSDPTPITKVDGSPLFDKEERKLIIKYASAKSNFDKAKTEEDKTDAKNELESMREEVRKLYSKAMSYLKENSIDLDKECAYQPWSEALTQRVNAWCALVSEMKDPKVQSAPVQYDSPQDEVPNYFSAPKENIQSAPDETADTQEGDEFLPF